MPRPSTAFHDRSGSPSPASHLSATGAVRTVLDGVGFVLLCLLSATGPAALRRQLDGGWDAGFAPQSPA